MGVNLSGIIESDDIEFSRLANKKIAIDAFNALYQFLSSIRQYDGTPLMDRKGRVTSHLSGLFYRTAKLLENNIKPIYVFDGKAPSFKRSEQERRREIRDEAAREWKEALNNEDYGIARKYAQASSNLTSEMIEQSKSLLKAMGIPVVQAPSEAEAEASVMAANGLCYAAASQDYDSLLFGAPILLRNISITGKRKVFGRGYVQISPERINLEDNLNRLGIDRDKLIALGILVGTDFNPGGIKGIGPKKALSMVKKYSIEQIKSKIEWTFDTSFDTIFDFFKNPPYEEPGDLEQKSMDTELLKRILCDEHDFSEDRVDKVIGEIKRKRNSTLSRWF